MGEPVLRHNNPAVRRGSRLVFCGDGQVSLGNSVMKGTAVKVRTLLMADPHGVCWRHSRRPPGREIRGQAEGIQ